MNEARAPFILGWEEWVALPELGLPSVKAKVDTGAKTSALHAHFIEPFGPASAPMVRFAVHPVPAREDIEVTCSAPVIDRREVTSSNGEREQRYVIETRIKIGERVWPIEVTLTNRESMSYRMLLGRQAIREDIFVDPISSFRQPRLSYKPYRHLRRRDAVSRPLRIGVLARRQETRSNRRLAVAAGSRGHVLELIEAGNLSLAFDGVEPGLVAGDAALPHYDAIIPFVSTKGAFGPALVRQLEMMGSYVINGADALDRLRNPIAVLQTLARAELIAPRDTIVASTEVALDEPVREPETRVRCLVVGGSVVATIDSGGLANDSERALEAAQGIAVRASAALQLGLAAVDVANRNGVPAVVAVSATPSLAAFETATGKPVAEAVIVDIEARVRSFVRPIDEAEVTDLADETDLSSE